MNPDNQLYAHSTPEALESGELEASKQMIRRHYQNLGAKAIVVIDKDNTVKGDEDENPSHPDFERFVKKWREKGVILSYNSNSSLSDLTGKLGMEGLAVAELGGIIGGFKDGREIHLTESGKWFREALNRFHSALSQYTNVDYTELDLWANLYDKSFHINGPHDRVVLVNNARKVTGSFATRLIDKSQGGILVKGSQESDAFFKRTKNIFHAILESFDKEKGFPDEGGFIFEPNPTTQLVVARSAAVSKQKSMWLFNEALKSTGIPLYYIGDNKDTDDMTQIKGMQTMAVTNGTLHQVPNVIVATQPLAAGVIELVETQVLPQIK